MFGIHRALGTYRNCVTQFIALSKFSREKLVQVGLARERISIKPNFVDLPAPEWDAERSRPLFVGRLSPEKDTRLLAAAAGARGDQVLDVVGSGPDAEFL
jgi:glycosyltransferase involved in cell wall biosynthesis